jgi:hypothetical protein
MTALRVSTLSEPIRNEMARLKAAGHHLLPLGGGADGKSPLLRVWTGPSLTLLASRRTLEDSGLLRLVAAILVQLPYGEGSE